MRDLRAPLSGALCIPSSFVLYRFSEPVVRVERKKRFEKDNNYVDAFFQLVLGYID